MNIGFFDSGIGGLTVFHEVIKMLPEYGYVYLGDSSHAPYGDKSQEQILALTKKGVQWLFEHDAKIVILACNTASSQALRILQQEWLTKEYQDRKLLGIIIPVVEDVVLHAKILVGIIGTRATIASNTYISELRKINPTIKIIQLALPGLVDMIEQGKNQEEIEQFLELSLLPLKEAPIDTLILGCTHYPLIQKQIKKVVGDSVYIPDTNEIIAKKLKIYLQKHKDIEDALSKKNTRQFFTTGDIKQFAKLSKRFFGQALEAQKAKL